MSEIVSRPEYTCCMYHVFYPWIVNVTLAANAWHVVSPYIHTYVVLCSVGGDYSYSYAPKSVAGSESDSASIHATYMRGVSPTSGPVQGGCTTYKDMGAWGGIFGLFAPPLPTRSLS